MCIRDRMNTVRKSENLLPFPVISAAANGDTTAMCAILKQMCIRDSLRTLHAAPKGIYRRYVTFGYGECGKGGHAGGRGAQRVRPVSYTHLDVYKRQIYNR